MFLADVLSMEGGRCDNIDIGGKLTQTAAALLKQPQTLYLYIAAPAEKYNNRRIPVLLPADENGGLPAAVSLDDGVPYSARELIRVGAGLVQSMGHLAVKDAGSNGTYNTTNILYSGAFVVEYDLVETDGEGKHYVYAEPSILEEIVRAESEGRGIGSAETQPATGCPFFNEVLASSQETINTLKQREGPYVSSGKLALDIMVIMRLYEEETRLVERACLDPMFRSVLAKTSDGLDAPLFKVAFITNAAMMGLKVVFYPTALEPDRIGPCTVSCSVLKRLLAIQTATLAYHMPKIVEAVDLRSKRYTFCFKKDVKGSANWNLPGHTKVGATALPYHHARLRGQLGNLLEISNERIVTSLGVVATQDMCGWVSGKLEPFYHRATYAATLGHGADSMDPSEWRREVLLKGNAGSELPFRNKSMLMDPDFCLSGMCYHYLASGQGIQLAKRTDAQNVSGEDSICSGLVVRGEKNEKDGKASEPGRGAKPPLAETGPLPMVSAELASAFNNTVAKNMEKVLSCSDALGMFLGGPEHSPRVATRALKAVKNKDRVSAVKDMTPTGESNIRWLSGSSKFTYEQLACYSLVQLVLRHMVKTNHLLLPRDNDTLKNLVKKLDWTSIDLEPVWTLALEEVVKAPSLEPPVSLRGEEVAGEEEEPVGGKDGGSRRYEELDSMLSNTCSTFATGADVKDTMFSWSMLVLAERFCAIYNIVANPREYYQQVTRMTADQPLFFEGGYAAFEKMCRCLLPELEMYIPDRPGQQLRVCRSAVRGFENAVERRKNTTNSKVCKVKLQEFKLQYNMRMHGMKEVPTPIPFSCAELTREMVADTGSVTLRALNALFETLRLELVDKIKQTEHAAAVAARKEEYETDVLMGEGYENTVLQQAINPQEARSDEVGAVPVEDRVTCDTVMDDFFQAVNDNRSFTFRAALCHRQEYVALDVLQLLEKQLGLLITVRSMNNKAKILEEVHLRNKRMYDWVVPFSMPCDDLDHFLDLQSKPTGFCNCLEAYSGGAATQGGLDMGTKQCVKLLVIPQSIHLKNLMRALRFNTMACERRYFSDASTSLGFSATPMRTETKKDPAEICRWNAIAEYKCNNGFLKGTAECSGLYTNVMLADREILEVMRPRMEARKKIAAANAAPTDINIKSNKHTGFFAAVWSLCAEHDLETTTLGATLVAPNGPTPLLRVGPSESRMVEKRHQLALEAKQFFKEDRSGCTFYQYFLEMGQCVVRTHMTTAPATAMSETREDTNFFAGLVKKYGAVKPPGSKLWTLLEAAVSCFRNSVPVDWMSLVPDWTNFVLNLTHGTPNIDESGAVFETARFISMCARSFFGKCLDHSLDVNDWTNLLSDQKTWLGGVARAYEVVTTGNDMRSIECFLDSSSFMTNNNMASKLKLRRTEDETDRYAIWTRAEKFDLGGGGGGSECEGAAACDITQRARWLASAEAGVADHLSFSFVLASFCLFRVLLEGHDIHDLVVSPHQQRQFISAGQMVPLITGIKVSSECYRTFVNASTDASVTRCLLEGRFSDVELDPLFFYRFVGYTVGLVAIDDLVFEGITRRILEGFDFNGYDTSNWTLCMRHHFPAVVMGRRARLLSRPLAFIKKLVGLAATSDRFIKRVTNGEEDEFENRVCRVLCRLAKLILVKNVDSEGVSRNDILECCILSEDDVTVASLPAFYATLGAELGSDKLDYSYTKASNSSTNAQMAKMKKSARLINPNVSFNDMRSLALSIDTDEEALIDPSREAAVSTADTEVGRSGSSRGTDFGAPKMKDTGGAKSTDRSQDSTRRFASGLWQPYQNSSQSSASNFEYDDNDMEDDTEPPDHEIMSKSAKALKKIETLLKQSSINDNVSQSIKKMRKFLVVQVQFSEHDYLKYGVRPEVMKAGVEAMSRWNSSVRALCAEVVRECENLEGVGKEYDMSVVSVADYGNSKNISYISELNMSKPSFSNALAEPAEGDVRTRPPSFSWISLDPKDSNGDNQYVNKAPKYQGGARVAGHILTDLVQFGNETADFRIMAQLFASRVKDSYWSSAMPVYLEERPDDKKSHKSYKDGRLSGWGGGVSTQRPVANLRLNNKNKDPVALKHQLGLSSLYQVSYDERPTLEEEDIEDNDQKRATNDNEDVFVVLGSDTSVKERFKCLNSLWCCNNGIHPKNQIEILKKLLFKNMNALWVRVYDRHIATLNNWGVLNVNNADDLHFSTCLGSVHTEVSDKRPPLSVFHSRFLDHEQISGILEKLQPVLRVREAYKKEHLEKKQGKKTTSDVDALEQPPTVDDEDESTNCTRDGQFIQGICSREVLSACLDPSGHFLTTCVTNAASVLWTPGTHVCDFTQASSYEKEHELYSDQLVLGQEKELGLRNFLSTSVEVIRALNDGVFFQGERASSSRAITVTDGRVLRPVNYCGLSLVGSSEKSQTIPSQQQQAGTDTNRPNQKSTFEHTAPRGSIGLFQAAKNNRVLSETNNCALTKCHKAQGLVMSLRAVLNNTVGKSYGGQVFDNRSMRYHAGLSKGCLLDDELDLYSIHGRTNSVHRREAENDISLYARCAEHLGRSGAQLDSRIFITDWLSVVGMMGTGSRSRYNGYINATHTPYSASVAKNLEVTVPLKNVSPYNCKNPDKRLAGSACFLPNPLVPVRWMATRAPNIRVCLTNAGLAAVSRRIAQTDRARTVEDLIIAGTVTSFKLASNSSCISVDDNRYFLVNGNYLMGGRIEERNVMSDIYVRCKLRSEKHTVYNSLFPANLTAAFLATAVEGNTHSQGLSLIEHTSVIKNMEVASRVHKNFWSGESAEVAGPGNTHHDLNRGLGLDRADCHACPLMPPSVYTNDEEYVLLKMMYEISKSAFYYIRNNDQLATDKSSNSNVDVDTTRASLFAMLKCYREVVDQETGMPHKHALHFFRALLNFGGFSNAIASGDGEKSHHLLYTMNIVALNMAPKAIVLLVGVTGNNLKTTLVEVLQSCWFDLVGIVTIGMFNSSSDSTSSTQANLAYIAGKKTILFIDEVGYQGCFGRSVDKPRPENGEATRTTTSSQSHPPEERSYGDLNEIDASHGVSSARDCVSVWERISASMVNSKLKTCAQECHGVMAARARSLMLEIEPGVASAAAGPSPVKRKRGAGAAATSLSETSYKKDEYGGPSPYFGSDKLASKTSPLVINAFAAEAMWWNSMSGTVVHRFNDKKTVFNMLTHNEQPFVCSTSHESPWLTLNDARKRVDERKCPGCYSVEQLREALQATLGNFAEGVDLTAEYGLSLKLLLWDENNTSHTLSGSPPVDGTTEFAVLGKKACQELVLDDTLVRWVRTHSLRPHQSGTPVLSCVPSNENFSLFLKEIVSMTSREVRLTNHMVMLTESRLACSNLLTKDMTTNTGQPGAGFLYAFHSVYSGGYSQLPPARTHTVSVELMDAHDQEACALGPVLSRIKPGAITNHAAKSKKLSSVLFCGDLSDEIDEDPINNKTGRPFDEELLKIVERPASRSFPRVTTDGSCVLIVDPKDCAVVLEHMKKAIVDPMKTANTGTFVATYIDSNQTNSVTYKSPSSMVPVAGGDSFASGFVGLFSTGEQRPANSGTSGMSHRARKLYGALKKFKSNGRTTAVSAIASAVTSKADVNSTVSDHMLPGQFDSNLLKQLTSKHACMSLRGLHCKPVVSSISMTPIMTSNSYTLRFFVDAPLLKRIIIFPFDTQFMFSSQNDDVQTIIDVVDNGAKSIHSLLNLERDRIWRTSGGSASDTAALAQKSVGWVHAWNESAQQGLGRTDYVSRPADIAALLPAVTLQLLVKNSVLEHRDITSMAKLSECGNTFMHMYTTLTLSSRCELGSIIETNQDTPRVTGGSSQVAQEEEGCYREGGGGGEEEDEDEEGYSRDSDGFTIPAPRGRTTSHQTPTTLGCVKNKISSVNHLQMCNINPKSLNTMTMAVNRSRHGAWAKINAALDCVVFVDTPFVHTTRLYGEGCNLRLFVPRKAGAWPDLDLGWCIGMRLPNPDLGVKGYANAGPMVGAGLSIMKHVSDSWGSRDIRDVMYSCHHLHMLFELVMQFTHPKRRLVSIKSTKRKNEAGMDYVSVLFVCEIYQELMRNVKYPVFENEAQDCNNHQYQKMKNKKPRYSLYGNTSDSYPGPVAETTVSPVEIPMFLAMITNKSLGALRSTTNLSNLSRTGANNHTNLVKNITQHLGHNLNPAYLCDNCRKS